MSEAEATTGAAGVSSHSCGRRSLNGRGSMGACARQPRRSAVVRVTGYVISCYYDHTTPPVSTLLHTTAERAAQLKRVYRRARRAHIIDFIAAHLCFSTLSLHLWTASNIYNNMEVLTWSDNVMQFLN